MVASLPVFVNVAVPQLAMRIAAAQRKAFQEISVEFILQYLKSLILPRLGSTCQDLKSAGSVLIWMERVTNVALVAAICRRLRRIPCHRTSVESRISSQSG